MMRRRVTVVFCIVEEPGQTRREQGREQGVQLQPGRESSRGGKGSAG
jgi:hypothetical protein